MRAALETLRTLLPTLATGASLLALVPWALACGGSAPQQPAGVDVLPPAAGASGSLQPPADAVAPGGDALGAAPAGVAQPDPTTGDVGVIGAGDDPWCDALSVFRSACQGCHGEELAGGAPLPLVTYEQTLMPAVSDPSRTVQDLISERVHDTARPMPPLSQPQLSAAQLGALDAWLAAGAPPAAGGCGDLPAAPAQQVEQEPQWPADCQERHEIRAHDGGQPYLVPANTESTVDITIPVPWAGGGGPVQALAIRPLTNNKRVVHHWILYAGVGDFITSWSPGKPMETFPEGVGVHMPTDGSFRLNMHYYNVGNDQAELDESGLEVCITREPRPFTATTYMFSGPATVPAGARVDNVSTCTVSATEPVHLITSSPHMHSYGVASKLEVIRPGGAVEVLEDGPFNWEDQHITPIDAVVNDGDQIRVTCSYENTSDRTVFFGSSSEDEMCFNFARYYPMDAFRCVGGAFF